MDTNDRLARQSHISVALASAQYCCGKTFLYDLLNRQEIRARKVGRKTLIEVASIEAFLTRQPVYKKAE